MDKKQIRHYWRAVDCVTQSLTHPTHNQFAIDHAIRHISMSIGFDEVVIYYCMGEVIIAVNGSDGDPQEWESNLDAFPLEDKTHKSFRSHGIMIMKSILEKIPNLLENDKITFVGFSRGGPLVQAAAEELGIECDVVTFGSPRLYTITKPKLKYKHYMVYSIFDPVHRIPWRWFPPFFKHKFYQKFKITRRIHHKFSHTHYGELIEKFL